MEGPADTLAKTLEAREWAGRVVPIVRLRNLRQGIVGARDRGLIDEMLFDDELSDLDYSAPPELPDARSLIVIATPAPACRLTFEWRGQTIAVTIPPTYVDAVSIRERVRAAAAEALDGDGHRVLLATVPLKPLAVGSGLARYGKNNITYVDGMGSFHRLTGLFSDMPAPRSEWKRRPSLGLCGRCTACLTACPTGAITASRFMLHAERCLTYFNENETRVPEWVPPDAHECLVGCMRCQSACPENRAVLDRIEDGPSFSEGETKLLLAGVPYEELPDETAAKWDALELTEDLAIIERNLGLVLQASDR
ncbi:MAG: FeS-binding protein [Coriobacteriia bacterium]|nr:FeS-binding protein [Coriobacteriia bacterium]